MVRIRECPTGEALNVLEKLYTVEEVAEYLGLRPLTIRGYLREGKIQGVRIGKHWRVKESALEAFLAAREEATPQEQKAASKKAIDSAKKRRSDKLE